MWPPSLTKMALGCGYVQAKPLPFLTRNCRIGQIESLQTKIWQSRTPKLKSMPMPATPPEFVAFDLETTGLSPNFDRIVEVGAVRFDHGGHVIGRFTSLLNPERFMPARAFAIHGISNAMVSDAPTARELLPSFIDFLGDSEQTVMLAHHASFDAGFLGRELASLGLPLPSHRVVDTLALARLSLPKAPDHRLSTIADILGLEPTGAHRALADSLRVKDVWLALEGAAIPEHWVAYPIFDPLLPKPAPQGWERIGKAIESAQVVWIEYQGGTRGIAPRSITPRRFVHRGGAVYLVALCHLDAKEKEFRLDRIARHEMAAS